MVIDAISYINYLLAEVFDGLKCMKFLSVSPSSETLKDYILPALFEKCNSQDRDLMIKKVGDYLRIPTHVIATEAVKLYISEGNIKEAARFGTSARLY